MRDAAVRLEDLAERVGRIEVLDAVGKPLSRAVAGVVADRRLKDLLSGSWLGHPLHPLLTDIPIGAWTSSLVLDVVGGRRGRPAADRLVGVGVLAALPTAASGLSDWSDCIGVERRLGMAHATANATALTLYGASWLARRRGRRARGFVLSLAGAATMTVGAYLGGHLSFTRGVNVNRNAWDHDVEEWTDVAAESDLAEGEAIVVEASGRAVLLMQEGGVITGIADRCGHAGGPLHEGTFQDGCVECPWHASVFRLADGALVHGPATVPQPAFEVRVDDGRILVRSAPVPRT